MRASLLSAAGFDTTRLATLAQKALEARESILDATKTEYFTFQGQVVDQRTSPDYRLRLEAAKQVDAVLGLHAPTAKQTVTIVHRVELPDWMCPDHASPTIIEVPHADAAPTPGTAP